jgi:hypothetical protein
MGIPFFYIHQSHNKRIAPTRGLSGGHHVQEAIEALQTTFRLKKPFSPPCRALFIRSNATEWRRRPYWVKYPWLLRSIGPYPFRPQF